MELNQGVKQVITVPPKSPQPRKLNVVGLLAIMVLVGMVSAAIITIVVVLGGSVNVTSSMQPMNQVCIPDVTSGTITAGSLVVCYADMNNTANMGATITPKLVFRSNMTFSGLTDIQLIQFSNNDPSTSMTGTTCLLSADNLTMTCPFSPYYHNASTSQRYKWTFQTNPMWDPAANLTWQFGYTSS